MDLRPYSERREYLRAYHARRYHRRRRIALIFLMMRAYLEGAPHADGCAKCGGPGPFVIDHRDPTRKRFEIFRAVTMSLRNLWLELRECWALCLACDRAKTYGEDQPAIQAKRRANRERRSVAA